MPADWYAVYTHVQKERAALDHLQRQGYVAYLPVYRKQIRHAGSVRRVERPLFPRYLFVHVEHSGRSYHPIRSTVGVTDLVRSGELPIPVHEEIIQSIKRQENHEGIVELGRAVQFQKGDRVRVTSGTFEGIEALFAEMRDADRVELLLKIMDRAWRLVVRTADLEKA